MALIEDPSCLFCNGNCEEGAIEINKDTTTSSGRSIIPVLSQLLSNQVQFEFPQLLCVGCNKIVEEMDSIQNKVSAIKNKTTKKPAPVKTVKIIPKLEPTNVSVVPKKILDIPSSDDDTNQISTDKGGQQSMEDIEMELFKIHGIDEQDVKNATNSSAIIMGVDETSQNFVDVKQTLVSIAGVGEHSSEDSDFENNANVTTDVLIKAAQGAEKNVSDSIKVKVESDSDYATEKPNILKKKQQPSSSNSSMDVTGGGDDKLALDEPVVSRDGNLYTCLLCEGDETVAGEAKAIIAHLRQEHNTRLYICDVCGQEFRKRNELSAHVDDHVANEEGDFQCEVCNRIFSNLRLFRIHKRMHLPQSKAWNCNTCGKKYSSKNLLEEHVNTHLGVRPYVCGHCGKNFSSKYTFKAHEKTHEVRPRPFTCSQCNKSFLSQQNLTQHEKIHTGMKEYACHLCGKQFGSAHNLEVHSIVHTGYKPFACHLCGKSFARKAEIRDHERTHTGERPYQCEFCGATFSQRSNLQSHKRATHYDDKRYRCNECGKGFKRRRLLDYHTKAVHTGERPFKCDVCEATFVYPEHFKKHRRIHTGEKPFECEVCGKAFNSRDNRNAHRFVHSDKKPYECLVCGAGFMRKPLLYQHMQAQGHLNDTIVVNQPRLTTEEEVSGGTEMEIIETSSQSDTEGASESKLYIADADGNEHIIIDGQQLRFAEADDDEEVAEPELVNIAAHENGEFEEIITADALASGETQIIETPEGTIQLVKVKIPNENGEEEEAWIKIVPE